MPTLPPKMFAPGTRLFRNGAAATAQHASDLADYTAWLVAVRRHAIPAFVGRPLVAGHTYQMRTRMPHYTETLAFGLLVTGEGVVTVKNGDDTFNSVIQAPDVEGHTYTDAAWVWAMTPLDAVAANGEARALDLTDQSSPHMVTVTVTVTDGATSACKVHAMILLPLPRSQASAMPA